MPTVMIKVNVPTDGSKKEMIMEEVIRAVCGATGKPKSFIQVGIEECFMSFGGSTGPSANVVRCCYCFAR